MTAVLIFIFLMKLSTFETSLLVDASTHSITMMLSKKAHG